MKTTKRTYSWYTLHQFEYGEKTYFVLPGHEKPVNAPSGNMNIEQFAKHGLADKVPTLTNIRPLIDMYVDWYDNKVSKDWNEYSKPGTEFLRTLHWILQHIFQDPTIDPEILRYAVNASEKFGISVVYNPSCPRDIIERYLGVTGTKDDPTKHTKGGEMVCFILVNKYLPSDLVDKCARMTKKVSTQKDVIEHRNVSRETLVYLSKNGKSDTVKKNALKMLVTKGWLTVK
jgi:hypothetical protein